MMDEDTLTVLFKDPWVLEAYGKNFIGATPGDAATAAEQYAAIYHLRPITVDEIEHIHKVRRTH